MSFSSDFHRPLLINLDAIESGRLYRTQTLFSIDLLHEVRLGFVSAQTNDTLAACSTREDVLAELNEEEMSWLTTEDPARWSATCCSKHGRNRAIGDNGRPLATCGVMRGKKKT